MLRWGRKSKPAILLLVWYSPQAPASLLAHIKELVRGSKYSWRVFNTYNALLAPQKRKIDINSYDAVVIHNTLSYSLDEFPLVEERLGFSLAQFSGLKVLMKQDEMRQVNQTIAFIQQNKIDLVLTCLEASELPKVYGEVKHAQFMQVFTGYVDRHLRALKIKPLKKRSVDVFYRGMETPYEWGLLGREKFEIAERFLQAAAPFDLKCDISSRTQDRIYGAKWLVRLQTSRAVLAVESGASIFDFDGSIEAWCKQARSTRTFAQAHQEFLFQFEGQIKYNQISPRHLEAACAGTVLVMYEGEYSGIFKPDIHYLALRKDFANMRDVVRCLKDDAICMNLINNARTLALTDPRLQIENMVASLDAKIAEMLS